MNKITGLKDLDNYILESIEDDESLFKICLANKYVSSLCNDTFFYKRIVKKYPKLLEHKREKETYKKFYLYMIPIIDKLKREFNFDYYDGNPEEIYKFLKWMLKYSASEYGNIIMNTAPKYNSISLLDYLLNYLVPPKFTDVTGYLNSGLGGAARSGNFNLVNYFISKGASNLNIGLLSAAREGHFELFNFFLDKLGNPIPSIDLFEMAIEGENINIVDSILKRYIPDDETLDFYINRGAISQNMKNYLKIRFNR